MPAILMIYVVALSLGRSMFTLISSQEETGACPLITPFGVHCLEKLGDTLLKNGQRHELVLAPLASSVPADGINSA